MFTWAVVCLVFAIAVAVFGFGGWLGPATGLARTIFVLLLFLALLVLLLPRR